VSLEIEVADDRRAKAADRVGQRRDADAWRELRRPGRTTERVAPLEDDRPKPGLAEVGSRHQAVVAAADDDRVVLVRAIRGQA
jgi:hypothetical protein